jgi:hypothetical protein
MRRDLQQTSGARLAGAARLASAVLLLVLGLLSVTSSWAFADAPEVTVSLAPPELPLGAPLKLTGRVAQSALPIAGAPLSLQADPYPYRGFTTIARGVSAPDGSFAFTGVNLLLNTHLRVLAEGAATATSAVLDAIVDPQVAIKASSLGPGRTRLSVRISHVPQATSGSVSARWFAAARGTRVFHLVAVTPTRELAAGLTYASATIDPPSKRFIYRVCLNARWERAMGSPASHGACPQHDYTVAHDRPFAYQGDGSGIPLTAYPSAGAIAAAARFLDSRAGRTSLAVVDNRGALSGLRVREHFQSASVVKVMMLVAYLQMLNAHHRSLGAADNALLHPMIHISDNNAASAVLSVVGDAALARVGRESGMRDYAPGVGWWAFTQTSAADQARFFYSLERLIPSQFYGYARGLLSGIEPSQSWGIPPVARPRWQVFFKTGALPSEGLFNEVGRLERPGVTFTIAVFTTGDPSMSYGEETIQGVAAILLAGTPH